MKIKESKVKQTYQISIQNINQKFGKTWQIFGHELLNQI